MTGSKQYLRDPQTESAFSFHVFAYNIKRAMKTQDMNTLLEAVRAFNWRFVSPHTGHTPLPTIVSASEKSKTQKPATLCATLPEQAVYPVLPVRRPAP